MTLNLMLAGPVSVFLSGDFRLTIRSPYYTAFKDDLRVQKLVPVYKRDWSALVSYAGIARTPSGQEVGEWLVDAIDDVDDAAQFDALLGEISLAQEWVAFPRPMLPIIFSIVGFLDRKPVAAVISNCQAADGSWIDPSRRLEFSTERPKEPRVRVAGDADSVLASEMADLGEMLRLNRSPREIHEAMARVNVEASDRSKYVSPQCVTGHLLPSGAGEITCHGIPNDSEYMPEFVRRDLVSMGVTGGVPRVGEDGRSLPPRWVGMTIKVVRERGRRTREVRLHAIRNIEKPVGGEPQKNVKVAWKRATANEPPYYTFHFGSSGPDADSSENGEKGPD